jgi:beta-galactosidase
VPSFQFPIRWGFCAPVVTLARLTKRVWTTYERFTADVDVSNYGPSSLQKRAITWQLQGEDGRIVAQEAWPSPHIVQGRVTHIGTATAALDSVIAAEKLTFRVELEGINVNSWAVWVFPRKVRSDDLPCGVIVSTRRDQSARNLLHNGGSLLLLPSPGELRDSVPGTFITAYWNVQMKRAQPAKTMGLLIDDAHPCLDGFPTEYHSTGSGGIL